MAVAVILGGLFVLLSHHGPPSRRLPASWQRGLNLTSFKAQGFASPVSDSALASLRATGADSVAVVVYWYMSTRTDDTVSPDPVQTPTDASVTHAMQTARRLGLRVLLKPQVDVRDGTFRGEIAPTSPAAWFASYTAMIDHYAELASGAGASTLVVGDELTSMAAYADAFRALIASVRPRFRGLLTFAANWVQGAEKIAFWPALDVIGIDAYMPLDTHLQNPTVPELVRAWQQWRVRLSALHERYGRPVLFTELGYPSRSGAATAPATEGNGSIDQVAQARAYDAAYRALRGLPWFEGIYWWEWSADGENSATADGSYRPAGKSAETVMRYFNDQGTPRAEGRLVGPVS